MSSASLSFLSGGNADFIADLYTRYGQNPSSVDPSWAAFFAELNAESAQPSRGQPQSQKFQNHPEASTSAEANAAMARDMARASVRALMLIRAWRAMGHIQAAVDPLAAKTPTPVAECEPAFWGFTPADADKPIFIDGVLGLQTATLAQIMARLKATYSGAVGYEFLHIQDHEKKQWLQKHIESDAPALDANSKKTLLEQLTHAEGFEKFLAVKFPGAKRFGLEGGEATIPCLLAILEQGAVLGLEEVVFGMAHRGRLNVLTTILGKSTTGIFSEFQGTPAYPDSVQGSGDVKYHMGFSADRVFAGRRLHLTLSPNPSHLEFVNPVVTGRVRAKISQRAANPYALQQSDFSKVMGVLIHGDAAFAGQGVVAETLQLEDLIGYRTGGTMHVVINNQIGFTTNPEFSKSAHYCSDIAKMIAAPIFHVNGDDPEAVARVGRLAMAYRQHFASDVVIDVVCYRRHGHNEGDEPSFTQPLMYQNIRARPTTRDMYAKKLVDEKTLSQAEADNIQQDFMAQLEKDFTAAATYRPNKADWLEGKWAGLQKMPGEEASDSSGVAIATLKQVGAALYTIPAGFDLNSKVAKQLEAKQQMVASGEGVDWATAEALAFGSLLLEGHGVRLSGQDVGRGTFSQRHSVWVDQSDERRYVPLNHITPDQKAQYQAFESPLSETAVLGFDYGYSLAEPNALVLWEAQFGDFANGAQVIIDQFIAAAETKWLRLSGLVMLLPHAMEGQGSEHSSARLERFLQLCAEDNWQVANCSTPANYFHILRRQLCRNFRKPLVLMTPKSLLRHKLCVSTLAEMAPASFFQPVIDEPLRNLIEDRKIRRVVLCTGKVYYDVFAEREARGVKDIALVRVEELYPFPQKQLVEALKRYPMAEVVWLQEEPENGGAWHYMDRRVEAAMRAATMRCSRPVFIGRPAAAAPATGYLKRHNKEQAELMDKVLAKN